MMHTTSLLPHLMLLKEVTDQGRLQYDHPLGLCLVAAGRGDTIPLKETFDLPNTSPNCTFSGEQVPIDLKRFTDSGINLVECPRCGRMRSLSPSKGVLRFKAHTPRKQQTPLTEKRWSATGKTDWSG